MVELLKSSAHSNLNNQNFETFTCQQYRIKTCFSSGKNNNVTGTKVDQKFVYSPGTLYIRSCTGDCLLQLNLYTNLLFDPNINELFYEGVQVLSKTQAS